MTEHFTTLRLRGDGLVVAWCPDHGQIGSAHRPSEHGYNAVVTEARGHDNMLHDVYRSVKAYRVALALEAQQLRAGGVS